MKTLLSFLAITVLFLSCEGPAGPPGIDGIDGSLFEAPVFEIETDLVLNKENTFYETDVLDFPEGLQFLPSDVILVYRLESVTDDGLNVWKQLPLPVIINQGSMYYNFDFTEFDYNIYLEPEFNVAQVPTEFTRNQVFRIVAVPGSGFKSAKASKASDFRNIKDVMTFLNVSEEDITTYKLN